ncbi:MAG: hypothetical protein WBW48_24825 [Anaerolineae bacterium]
MSDIAIRVENLSKQYRIGGRQAAYRTLREALTDAAVAPFRRLRRNPKSEFGIHLGAEGRLLRGETRRGEHLPERRYPFDSPSTELRTRLRTSLGMRWAETCPEPAEGSSASSRI